jgi:transketolase
VTTFSRKQKPEQDEPIEHPKGSVEELAINTIRTLAMDAVEAAKSGHAGTPMALAPLVYTLWQNHLRYDPKTPAWPNRDRFVLSNGHASMLLYAILHLTETRDGEHPEELAVKLDDIKRFRQLGSKCPGHPEYGLTTGVEATTGPLGQGVGNSVGMAIASRWLAATFNKPDFDLFDFNVYAVCSDGDLMEGISGEAASLAAHLKLSNLCWIYDDNHITIEGETSLAFSENVGTRFKGYGWSVKHVPDVNDLESVGKALGEFKNCHDRPTLIIVRSHIGYGSPNKQDKASAHSEPLGEDESRLTKKFYGWPENAQFYVPEQVRDLFRQGIGKKGLELYRQWQEKFDRYTSKYPELADQLNRMQARDLPENWDSKLPTFTADHKGLATRDSSGKVLNAIAENFPWLIGGSGDLAPSTKTLIKSGDQENSFEAHHYGGRNFHFGIREHAMGAVVNGLALSRIRAFGSTFLIFSDYQRPPIRLSALMEIPSIHIFTHDSISLGEDGPTHQPISELTSLRAIPGLVTLRPADANEVVECWKIIIRLKHQPAALVLTRQPLPTFDRTQYAKAEGVQFGAYALADCTGRPDVILIGTGSEVQLCLQAYERLKSEGIKCRVVSMPSWDVFEKQNKMYRERILPPEVKARVSVEEAATLGWDRYVGPSGISIGMTTFGASAPLADVQKHFGFTVEHVIQAAKEVIQRTRSEKTGE